MKSTNETEVVTSGDQEEKMIEALLSLRHGSHERDRPSAPARSSPVMLSAAKHLARWAQRCFAALSMTSVKAAQVRSWGSLISKLSRA